MMCCCSNPPPPCSGKYCVTLSSNCGTTITNPVVSIQTTTSNTNLTLSNGQYCYSTATFTSTGQTQSATLTITSDNHLTHTETVTLSCSNVSRTVTLTRNYMNIFIGSGCEGSWGSDPNGSLGGAVVTVYQGSTVLGSGTTTVTTGGNSGPPPPNLTISISAENDGEALSATVVTPGWQAVTISLSNTCSLYWYYNSNQSQLASGYACSCCPVPTCGTMTLQTPQGNVTLTLGSGFPNPAGGTIPTTPDPHTYYGQQTLSTLGYPPYFEPAYPTIPVNGCPNPQFYPWKTTPAVGSVTVYFVLTDCHLAMGIASCFYNGSSNQDQCLPCLDADAGYGTFSYYGSAFSNPPGPANGFTPSWTALNYSNSSSSVACLPFQETIQVSHTCGGLYSGTFTITNNCSGNGSYPISNPVTPGGGMTTGLAHPFTQPASVPTRSAPTRELVVSRYNEWVGWTKDSPIPTVVYNKGDDLEDLGPVQVVKLDNVGREAFTMLYHIVTHYHCLADVTCFVQGTTHSGTELFGRLAEDYPAVSSLTEQYLPGFPSASVRANDLVQDTPSGLYTVRYGLADYHGNRQAEDNREWLGKVWERWMTSARPKDWRFAYGAELAVPRSNILARPLAFWRSCLEACAKSVTDPDRWDEDPSSAWAFELLWLYLFDPAFEVRTTKAPGIFTMARNFLASTARQLAEGNPVASLEVISERKSICEACPLFDSDRRKCNKCGCTNMDLKWKWATSSCPDDPPRWEAVNPNDKGSNDE